MTRPLASDDPQPARPRILVVDDEDPIRFSMKEYFDALGYEVDCAREPQEAEALLGYLPYAVVIADLRLTGIHGTEGLGLIRFIREQSPSTRTILLTAYGSADVESEARRLGVDSVLNKPKPLPDLAQIVVGLLAKGEGR
jgi:CheY-like chemotaxis protein